MIRDRNIDWLRSVYRIPYHLFGYEPTHLHTITILGGVATATSHHIGLGTDANGGALAKVSATSRTGITGVQNGEALVGLDVGAPQIAEVSTFGFGGVEIAAAGDSLTTLDLWLPPHFDPEQEIGVRVLWTTNGAVAASDAITWLVTYKQSDVGEALAAPATALDTVIASASPVTTTLLLRRTARGIINANKFDYTARQGALAWNVEADVLTGFSADEVVFLALELDYVPLVCANRDEKIDVFSALAVND